MVSFVMVMLNAKIKTPERRVCWVFRGASPTPPVRCSAPDDVLCNAMLENRYERYAKGRLEDVKHNTKGALVE